MSDSAYTEDVAKTEWDEAVTSYVRANIDEVKKALRVPLDRTLADTGKSRFNEPDTMLNLYGVVKSGSHSDIVRLPEIRLQDIYFENDAPIFDWIQALKNIEVGARNIVSEVDQLEAEYQMTVWVTHLYALKRYLGISSGHDQIITTLFDLAYNESKKPVSKERLNAVIDALGIIEGAVHIDDRLVDGFLDRLEASGVDCMAALSAADECATENAT